MFRRGRRMTIYIDKCTWGGVMEGRLTGDHAFILKNICICLACKFQSQKKARSVVKNLQQSLFKYYICLHSLSLPCLPVLTGEKILYYHHRFSKYCKDPWQPVFLQRALARHGTDLIFINLRHRVRRTSGCLFSWDPP